MLAPVGEASWGEDEAALAQLRVAPALVRVRAELEAEAGSEIELSRRGALHVALDRDEAEELRRRYELHARHGLESEWLPARLAGRSSQGSPLGVTAASTRPARLRSTRGAS